MKFQILILIILGIAAALCASLLVASMRADRKKGKDHTTQDSEIHILVASKALPAMSILDAEAIEKKSILRSQAPEKHFDDSIQLLGRVLATPMVTGQPYTPASLVTDGSGAHLASVLPEGKRAVSITLPDASGLAGLIYPGSLVDVVASFKLRSGQARGVAVSTTILQNIQVLASEDQSVVSPDKPKGKRRRLSKKHLRVTLMVDTKQAEVLKLAVDHGSVSLSMRNPTDDSPVDLLQGRAVINHLSESFLAQLAEREGTKRRTASQTAQSDSAKIQPSPAPRRTWQTILIRGSETETHTFSFADTPKDKAKLAQGRRTAVFTP